MRPCPDCGAAPGVPHGHWSVMDHDGQHVPGERGPALLDDLVGVHILCPRCGRLVEPRTGMLVALGLTCACG